MTPGIQQWPDESLERQAYNAVKPVPVVEENDRNRLGYHVFLYLKGEYPTIDEAIHVAQPRLRCGKTEASRMISELLSPRPESEVS
ncbi:MAG: hypothetical protein IH600_18700 [Bacteroidetes bacterium]|nr:hypothetical protein [Bacteroidota bacterium]